jgi:hypothetical protein
MPKQSVEQLKHARALLTEALKNKSYQQLLKKYEDIDNCTTLERKTGYGIQALNRYAQQLLSNIPRDSDASTCRNIVNGVNHLVADFQSLLQKKGKQHADTFEEGNDEEENDGDEAPSDEENDGEGGDEQPPPVYGYEMGTDETNWDAPWEYSQYTYDAPLKVWTFDGKPVPRNDLPPKLFDDDKDDEGWVGQGLGPDPVWGDGAPWSTKGYTWDADKRVWSWDGHYVPLANLPSNLWDDDTADDLDGQGKGTALGGHKWHEELLHGIQGKE